MGLLSVINNSGTRRDFKFCDNGNAYTEDGSWINASDIRKKSNVIPTFNYLQYLKAIQPITFIMEGKKGLGFLLNKYNSHYQMLFGLSEKVLTKMGMKLMTSLI